METIVRVEAGLAGALAEAPTTDAAARGLTAALERYGANLQPLHPGSTDDELRCYFTVCGIAPGQEEEVAATLRAQPGVRAAYVKPPAAPAG
ncbi:MAG: hypothetical protein BroJett029_02930 [Alphaproteobacteria bacterium]|nr:MAG: hypothetical protein BroJett029_02930 [Alphaproteobacteria bacterium]